MPTEAEIEAAARVIDAEYWSESDCPLAQIGQNIYEWDGTKESLAKARAALEAAERVRAAIKDARVTAQD